ncbi:hypothetical protein C0993_003602 [Termitomyces sp. T159_Od127]|nr:hypothetical protein C0993_003602 [Termitomyces sp. T159_Od127]
MRAFLFNGSQKWKMDVIVEYIPTLLHASLFLFFAGLIIFLYELNVSVSIVVAAVTFTWLVAYVLATIAPVIDTAAPYETLLTDTFWSLFRKSLRLFYRLFSRNSLSHSLASIGQDLATVRTSLALNPRLPENISSPDARIFMWTRAMIAGDQELELFLESIPGFLSSVDGCKTWAAVYSNSSDSLQYQITQLLATCARTAYMDPIIRQRRASTCIEALFAISQYEIHHAPARGTERSAILGLTHYIRTILATKDQTSMPITKGICTLALLWRQHFISKFAISDLSKNNISVPNDRVCSIPSNVLHMSQRADKALKMVDEWRLKLEEGLKSYTQDPQNHQTNMTDLCRQYVSIVGAKSRDLLDWGKTIGPILYEYDIPKQHPLLSWYSLLPEVRHSLTCNISELEPPEGAIEVYAPQVLVLMRRLGIYPQLSDMSLDFTNPMALPSPSFQIQPSWTNTEDYKPLHRELEPLSRFLNLLGPSSAVHQVEVHSERLNTAFIYNVPYPDRRPILTDLLGPFSTIAFVLEDIRHGARIVALLDLVMKFKTFAPRIVEPHIIHEMIDTIFTETSPQLQLGSQVLFVAVLRTILDWERDQSTIQPCPFSDSDITLLVEHLKNLSYKLSLDAAEQLFGLSPTDASHKVSGMQQSVPAGMCKAVSSPPQNVDSTLRIQAVYSHVLAQRAKTRSNSSQTPSL